MAYLTFPQLERSGRLGNCLWQIASTIGLARRHGMEPRFNADWSYRKWFSVPDEFFVDDVSGTPSWALPDAAHIDERTRVYLQDLAFFEGAEDEIRRYFQPSALAYETVTPLLWESPLLAIHVRRTDAVTQPDHYPLPSLDYYLDAVRRHPVYNVAIFGDDHEWNSGVLAPRAAELTMRKVRAIEGRPRPAPHMPDWATVPVEDWIDLCVMVHSNALCLSNSTYGWWSAWLSGSEDVTCPWPWYGRLLDVEQEGFVDASLMIPPGWTRWPNQGVPTVEHVQAHMRDMAERYP